MAEFSKATGQVNPHGKAQAPIRLGVLLDDDLVPSYVNTLLNELSTRPDMELAAVIVHRQRRSAGLSAYRRFLAAAPVSLVTLDRIAAKAALFFVTGIEALVLRLRNQASHPLRHEPFRHPSASVVRITPLCAEFAAHCQYSQTDLDVLTGLSLDFLVDESEQDPALSARASLARFGAIRMRFGNCRQYRGIKPDSKRYASGTPLRNSGSCHCMGTGTRQFSQEHFKPGLRCWTIAMS